MTQVPPGGRPAGAGAVPHTVGKTSGAAVASLVCGILSFCTFGLTAIPGIILGIVGIGRVGSSQGRLRGMGLAVAGLVLSVVGLLLMLAAAFALLLVAGTAEGRRSPMMRARPSAVRMREGTAADLAAESMVAMQLLVDAAQDYAAEHDGRFPTADEYPAAVRRYYREDAQPKAPPGREYAMNAALSGVRVSDLAQPERTVLFFEVHAHERDVGGKELLRQIQGRDDAYVIAFADGHIEWVPPGDIDELIWNPEGPTVLM